MMVEEIEILFIRGTKMAKQKNTSNKKKHTKLLNQKKAKKQKEKELNRLKIREMNKRANN